MKHVLRIFVAVFIATLAFAPAQAQLPDGSIAPDWTMDDLEGNTHNLYSYLDQGMSVIIDFSAIWCGPCWSYHTGGALEEVYTLHGPETGDGTIMVFYIEGDQGTVAQLNGGAGSAGNWVAGTDYPIVPTVFPNSNQVTSDYSIGYWPTIYTVCPSRIITETGQISADAHVDFTELNCAAAFGTNNAAAQAYLGSENYCGEAVPTFRLMNLGTEDLTSAEIELHVNGSMVETVSWTGSLATYGNEDITFAPVSGTADLDIEMIITSTNGGSDDDTADDIYAQTIAVAPALATMDVVIDLRTDGYGDEVYWAIVDDAGTIVADGGNPNVGLTNIGTGTFPPPASPDSYANDTDYSIPVTLPAEACYDVIVVDYYGDGMSLPQSGTPFFSVTDPSSMLELHYVGGTDYVNSAEVPVDANGDVVVEPAPQANFTYTISQTELSVVDNSANAATWAWDFGDGNTSDLETPGVHTYATGGIYEVCLTVTNTSGSDNICQSVFATSPSSVEDIAALEAISVYPNPATDLATVSLSLSATAQITVELTNTAGQVVFAQTSVYSSGSESININTAELSAGTYFVNIKTDDGIATEKLIVTN